MKHTPTAREWMSQSRITLAPSDEMGTAIRVLSCRGLSCVPVVGADGELLGVLTEKDCLRTYCRWVYEGLAGGRVRDHMSSVKVTLTPEMDLLAVASIFLQNHFPSLPVQEDGKLVGMIYRLDVLRGILHWERFLVESRQEYDRQGKRPTSIEEMQRVVGSLTREQAAERLKGD